MAFQQGLSGLSAASKALDVVGNNIANSNTVGFKSAKAHFADVYSASMGIGASSQVGIGVSVPAIQQAFNQANIETTNYPLDLAINGDGFYKVQRGNTQAYTRNGQFHLDKDGFVINDNKFQLMGYPATPDGIIVPANPIPLQVDVSNIPPRPTGDSLGGVMVANFNLDARVAVPSQNLNDNGTALQPQISTSVANPIIPPGAGTLTISAGSPAIVTAVPIPAAATLADVVLAINGSAAAVTASINGAGQLVVEGDTPGLANRFTMSGIPSLTTPGAMPITQNAQDLTAAHSVFNPANPLTYSWSQPITVYDTLGVDHSLTLFFVRTPTGGNLSSTWNVYGSLDGDNLAFGADNLLATPPTSSSGYQFMGNMEFNPGGTMTVPAPGTPLGLPAGWTPKVPGPTPNTMVPNGAAVFGTDQNGAPLVDWRVDFTGTSAYGGPMSNNKFTQGGFAQGAIANVSVSAEGILRGNYSNGQSKNLGQVVLADFPNVHGLLNMGNNLLQETATSGGAIIGAPGAGKRGLIQSMAVEASNVDLTVELVDMITLQRAYQANAQTIKTQDQLMQTLVNLR